MSYSQSSSHSKAPLSPLTARYISPTPRSLYTLPPGHHSPLHSDLRTKLGRRTTSHASSRSHSPVVARISKSSSVKSHRSVTKLVHSKLRGDRSRSRSPTRPYSRQTTRSPRRKTPSSRERTQSPRGRKRSPTGSSRTPRGRTKSPQFRTPYRPHRKSEGDVCRGSSSSGDRGSSKNQRDERSSSTVYKDRSSSRLPREESSHKEPHDRQSKSKEVKSSSHKRSIHSSPVSSRRVVESSSEYQPTPSTSTVLAGVDVESSVNRILQKIVAKNEKKKKGKKKEKMELVLRKKKKTKKSKLDEPRRGVLVKAEPQTDHEPPSPATPAVNIKTEPGAAPPQAPEPGTLSQQYFKPGLEIELQPILGHSKCRICKSYFPDTDDRRSQHLAQHPDRVFVVNLPVDTYYYDMEEAISHMAKFGINRIELQQKVKDCNLIKLPTSLKGFSCNICKMLDTNSEKEFIIHVKEECKVAAKEERAQHLVCFCRGCHARFRSKTELEQHSGKGGCWPSMMVINRLYDMSGGEVGEKKKDKAVLDKQKMVRVKQEKIEKAQQIQIKRERFAMERGDTQEMLTLQTISSPMQSMFNAYSLPSSQEALHAAPPVGPSAYDLHKILQSVQPNNGMQATSTLQQMDMVSMQGSSHMHQMDLVTMQGIQQMQFQPPSLMLQQVGNQMPANFSIPPPRFPIGHPYMATSPPPLHSSPHPLRTQPPHSLHSFSPTSHISSPDTVKAEIGVRSPTLSGMLEPSPGFSPLRASHRSSSRRPSEQVVVPPPPSTPLPTLDDLFTRGATPARRQQPQVRRQRFESGSSIASCDSLDQQKSSQNNKMVSTYNCQRAACLWTDPHTSTCSKLPIMARCSTDSCNWYDMHRDQPLCDKLSFYCNCKKEREGVYKYYDNIKQVLKIPTEMDGTRDLSVKEPKHVVMRLLYRMVSKVVGDPRLSKINYPTPQNIPARSFRGKGVGRRGWGEDCVICTWSGVGMVEVRRETNPHLVSDHESDVEFCEEEEGSKIKKFSKRMEKGGRSQKGEYL